MLNPATLLYVAVLAFAGWSFVAGVGRVDDAAVESLVEGRLARRTTTAFLVILALLFGATWLSQMGGSIVSGKPPADLVASGWPMNPIYVLDLGFVLPLAIVAALRLTRHQPGGARIAVPFLVFCVLRARPPLSATFGTRRTICRLVAQCSQNTASNGGSSRVGTLRTSA